MEDPDSVLPVPENAKSLEFAPLPPVEKMETTAVDGQGMWRAWTRVFKKPEDACLDLIDNCFDATLHVKGFHGKVVMDSLEGTNEGIIIMNNSGVPIKSLDEALTVYKSCKNDSEREKGIGNKNKNDNSNNVDATARKDAIGENGVGLKHGCATLCDTSYVLTRNKNMVEVGVIAKALQSQAGVYLPSFTFNVTNPRNLNEIIYLLDTNANRHVSDLVAKTLGKNNLQSGLEKLARQIHMMFGGEFQDDEHVFQLVLCDLHHSKKIVIDVDSNGPPLTQSKVFLEDIEAMLPEYYINIPSEDFDFWIDGKKIHFAYWQKRLVELTEFRLRIPKDEKIEEKPDLCPWWDMGYKLKVFCGFDAQRMKKGKTGMATNCKLYIYSREAGRLIEAKDDARHLLNLCSTGTDFMQGFTVIVVDVESQLPLMPTKDGIAWTEQRDGEIHRSNLFAWAGAVATLYWNYHSKSIMNYSKNPKELLANIVRSFAVEQAKDDTKHSEITENISSGKFSWFDGVKWKKRVCKSNDKLLIRKTQRGDFFYKGGKDTIYRITEDLIKQFTENMVEKKRQKKEGQSANSASLRTISKSSVAEPLHDSENALGRPSCPVSPVSQIGLKRTKKPVNYGEDYVETYETDEEDLVFVTPAKRSPRKKAKRIDNDVEQKLIEKAIQLKEEQLKTLKAEREAQEARKQCQAGEEIIRKLLAKVEHYKNRKPSPESGSRRDVANLQEQLRKTAQQRDRYKSRVNDYKSRVYKLERLVATNGIRTKRGMQPGPGNSAHQSLELGYDSTTESENEGDDDDSNRVESI